MIIKFIVVIIVGMLAGLINAIINDKKIRLPKIRVDEYGKYLDLGILKEMATSIVAAFIVALPVMAYVPVTSLIISCTIPAIAGAGYIRTLVDKYIEKEKEEIEKELHEIETDKPNKQKRNI